MEAIIIFGAKYLFLLSPLIALVFFLKLPRQQRKSLALLGVFVLPVSYFVGWVVSQFYFSELPFVVGGFEPLIPHVADNGFPSHHTLFTAAIAAVVYVYNKNIGAYLWLIAILVGVSRMMAGVHHLIDVLGAILIALLVAWVGKKIFKQNN